MLANAYIELRLGESGVSVRETVRRDGYLSSTFGILVVRMSNGGSGRLLVRQAFSATSVGNEGAIRIYGPVWRNMTERMNTWSTLSGTMNHPFELLVRKGVTGS